MHHHYKYIMPDMEKNKLGRLFHDLNHILDRMYHSNRHIRKSLDNYNIELGLNELDSLIDRARFLLNTYRALEAIECSNLHLYSRRPVDLLTRLINKEKNIRCSNGVLWVIGSEESELLPNYLNADDYYLTAINCVLDNAVNYACPGSIININMYSDKLVISNVGIPIYEDEMVHIYDCEYRGRASIRHHSYGLGNGLFIAKKVFETYESTISITSESIYEKNEEVETLIVRLINMYNSIPKNKNNLDVLNALTDIEFDAAKKTIEKICNIYDINYDSKFHYINRSSVAHWIDYWDYKKTKFTKEEVKEDAIIFFKPIAKVTVTIKYGKEKENINN